MPCVVWGCHNDVDAYVDKPSGQRAVCEEHVADYSVIEEVP